MAKKKRKNPSVRKTVTWTRAEILSWLKRNHHSAKVIKAVSNAHGSNGSIGFSADGNVIAVEGLLQHFPDSLIGGIAAEGLAAFQDRRPNAAHPKNTFSALRAWCEAGKHYPEEVVADAGEGAPMGVLVYGAGGRSTNRWEDGVAGVQKEYREAAEEDESPACPEHSAPVSWVNVRRDKNPGIARRPNVADDDCSSCCESCLSGPPEAPWCSNGICPCHPGRPDVCPHNNSLGSGCKDCDESEGVFAAQRAEGSCEKCGQRDRLVFIPSLGQKRCAQCSPRPRSDLDYREGNPRGQANWIPGRRLTPRQRAEVLRAFVHRYTGEHPAQGWTPTGLPQYATDQDWLNAYAFAFTADGSRLSGNRHHAEPVYMHDRSGNPSARCDDCRKPYAGGPYYTFPTETCSVHSGAEKGSCTGTLCPACAGPDLEPDREGDPRRPRSANPVDSRVRPCDNCGLRSCAGDCDEGMQGAPTCSMCGGPGAFLGQLGSLEHFRCRNCGMDFHRKANPAPSGVLPEADQGR